MLCLFVLLFKPVNLVSYHRLRQQKNSLQNNDPSYDSALLPAKSPSGSIGGTSYYSNYFFNYFLISVFFYTGIGADPNYGSFIARPNRPGSGAVLPISYDQNSQQFQYLMKPRRPHQQHLPKGNNQYNYNYPNLWQRPRAENQKHQLHKHYLPLNGGWYSNRDQQASQRWDGNRNSFWRNRGQSIIAYPSLVFITLTILLFL